MSFRTKFLAAVACLTLCLPAFANVMYSTGADSNHDGRDDLFTVNGVQAYLVTATAAGWPSLPNGTATSGRYISWDPIQSGRNASQLVNMQYDYQFKFNWADSGLNTLFDFRWISDDFLTDITLNGASLGVNNIGKTEVWKLTNSASATGAVVQGVNTINFRVLNNQGGASGLAADFTIHGGASVNDVPEPSSIWLAALALGALALMRKRSLFR